ncbi:phosphoesterase family-domain-containing protein [Gongronella butleri]|nr:phosphoesterase family-domain-containing protein [Gongronella butleri]
MKIQAALMLLATVAIAHAAEPTAKDRNPGLDKIKHVVLFMQENRAFDHYFGTLAGTRNFQDPNAIIQDNGLSIFYQPDEGSPDVMNGQKYLLPFRLDGNRGGCMIGGTNGWYGTHFAWNYGKMNDWPGGNAPGTMGYFTREEIPFHYAMADNFALADRYHASVLGPTIPNRVTWMSGTVIDKKGNPVYDNVIPKEGYDWESYPEVLTRAGVTWQVFQDEDNFDDNSLAWFKHFKSQAGPIEKNQGTGFLGLKEFYKRTKSGTLPQVSILVAPRDLSEHPNNPPNAGAWIQNQVFRAVTQSPKYNETALIISYDEAGGFADHVAPPLPPRDKWVKIKNQPVVPTGLGVRVPFLVVSPWTRGASTYTEILDHTSQLKFLEQWIGYDAKGNLKAPAKEIEPWRRETVGDFVDMFDFDHPDYTVPAIPAVKRPPYLFGGWRAATVCELFNKDHRPRPPYRNQAFPTVETGTRHVRGRIGEGHTYAFVQGDLVKGAHALDVTCTSVKTSAIQSANVPKTAWQASNYFVVRAAAKEGEFTIESHASHGACLAVNPCTRGIVLAKCNGAKVPTFTFEYNPSGMKHTIKNVDTGLYVDIDEAGLVATAKPERSWSAFAVSY